MTQDCVQSGFGYLEGWRLCSLSDQSIPVFDHPQFGSPPPPVIFNGVFCMLSLVLSLGTKEESLALSSLRTQPPSVIYTH